MGHGVSLLILYCTPAGMFLTWKRTEKQNKTKKEHKHQQKKTHCKCDLKYCVLNFKERD